MYFIGCDPGQAGGFVVIDQDMKVIDVFKTPEDRNSFVEKDAGHKKPARTDIPNEGACTLYAWKRG